MKYILTVSLFIFSCSPKIVSDKTVTKIEAIEREEIIIIPEMIIRDITPIDSIREKPTTKTDQKTGVEITFKIDQDENLITDIKIPEREEKATVTDTYTTTVKEVVKKPTFWQSMKNTYNTMLTATFVLFILYIIYKIAR